MTAPERNFVRGYAQRTGGKPGTPIPFVASTQGQQRDGLDLRASGWKLDNYRRSPVVLWCHDYNSEPIGRAEVVTGSKDLRAQVTFDQEDERAVRIERKVRGGYISAVSVGWDFVDSTGQRLDHWRMTAEELRDRAFYDLLEISVVPVPADPNALAERQRAALGVLGRECLRAAQPGDCRCSTHNGRRAWCKFCRNGGRPGLLPAVSERILTGGGDTKVSPAVASTILNALDQGRVGLAATAPQVDADALARQIADDEWVARMQERIRRGPVSEEEW